jgi:hypothetical protein
MSNTVIQLKYSDATSVPSSLNTAEPAYSNVSNKLFIGTSDGSVVAIGGQYYTGLIDAATSANTSSAIVKRGSDGGFSATYVKASLYGNANTATTLATARNILISGADISSNTVSFDGSAQVLLNANLSTTGVTAGTYGGASQIPVFTVDTKGRISAASNVSVSVPSTLNVAGDTGTGSLALTTDTLTINGRDGLSSIFVDANNTVLIDVDNTVLRTTGGTISGDLSVTGNLVVSGNTITQDVETIVTEDSLIQLAANNVADAIDIGLFGQYNDGTTKYTALARDASDGKYKLLTAGSEKPSAANTINVTAFSTATLVADIEANTVTIKGINVLDRTNTAWNAANTAQTTGQAAFDKANTVATTAAAAFDKANTAATTGQAAFDKANTVATTAQAAFDKANTDVTSISITAGDYGSASIVPVLHLEANGRVSSVTNTTIAIATSAITSGTLGVVRGGTGAASFTTKGVIVSDSSSTTGALSALTSSTEGHVLQINASGVPTFAHLNGGSF